MSDMGRTALVIGATRGIGAATARALLSAGYRTAGTHRTGGTVPEGVPPSRWMCVTVIRSQLASRRLPPT